MNIVFVEDRAWIVKKWCDGGADQMIITSLSTKGDSKDQMIITSLNSTLRATVADSFVGMVLRSTGIL